MSKNKEGERDRLVNLGRRKGLETHAKLRKWRGKDEIGLRIGEQTQRQVAVTSPHGEGKWSRVSPWWKHLSIREKGNQHPGGREKNEGSKGRQHEYGPLLPEKRKWNFDNGRWRRKDTQTLQATKREGIDSRNVGRRDGHLHNKGGGELNMSWKGRNALLRANQVKRKIHEGLIENICKGRKGEAEGRGVGR